MNIQRSAPLDGSLDTPLDDDFPQIPRGTGWVTPMQSRIWLRACYDTLYPAAAKRLVICDGALGPFARVGRLLPVFVLAGAEEIAEAIEPPVVDAAAARCLSEALLAERLPIRFGSMPADGIFTRIFVAAAQGRGILLSAPTGGSPVIRLHAGWTDPAARLNPRRRSDLRRMQRRAEVIGPVAFELHVPRPEDLPELLERAFAVEAKGWKARSRTAVLHNPAQAAFLRRYCSLVAAEGRCRIAFLRIGAADAAMQVMVEEDRALWLLKIGYDEAFARVSPGTLLLTETVRRTAADGLDRIEFLGKDAPWTAFWSEEVRPHLRLHFYPVTPRGLLALIRDAIRVTARRTWRDLTQGDRS